MFHYVAMKFQQPPVLPPNYIARHKLLEELVSAVMKAKLEPNRFGATITITGVGGFGKSILAKALCHHDTIKAKFSGFVLVELGPKSFDPVVELHQLYYQLTGKEFPTNQSNNPNIIVNEIRQVTIKHSDKLLVIIDDVWHVEDAEPIVEAFNNCKIIITTRENEISRWIPCKYSIIAGPMEPHEAISLLIDGVVLQTLLSENDHTLLDNIAHDVHLWPLLLSLVRGQFSHYIVDQHLPFKTAIGMIHQKLYAKGLTAFDRENVSNNIIKRKYAVKACIETTLDLLKGSDSLRMKVMVLFSGIGSTIPTIALHIIWKTSHLEANDTLSNLWGHGLVSYGSTIIPRYGVEQRHVEVHATISQFIIETLQTDEVSLLSVNFDKNIGVSFGKAVCEEFYRCYGLADPTSMSHEIILIHHLGSFEYFLIPYCLRFVNAWAVLDPYIFNSSILQMMLEMLTTCTLGYPEDITSTFSSQVNNLINDCQKIVIGLCSKKSLYQLSMKHLTEKNYDELLQELEDYHKQYPLGVIIERSVKLTKNFMVYCKDDHSLYSFCQSLLAGIYELTGPAHPNNVMIPAITLIVDVCKKIENCLKSNTEIKETAENLTQILENGMELIKEQYQIKELVPDFMCI